ncbi:hypothetical protein EDD80_10410 [Anseongella ginsenosidimutans]|uniref:PH (Pleckstrin Homology) domain-containing protein n=1 Tax=Anseongella ginsenosidimutans TaxID=496056 RepID=A0A4R3KS69_9SPHI|nr:hypothetical protein [Anseongella ginsenosidimutans]QEC53048.1 hypothetical protein FRZ59_12355 [Anseongella ginsenosidimutans]TCS87663.1 hypothetical protein EDD80_10410 [Anseongella ginsenosidimutans]
MGKIEKISGGSARLNQLMLLLFFLPFVWLLTYIILAKNFSLAGGAFLLFCIAMCCLIIRNGFSYADLYVSEHCLIIKKLFSIKSKPTAKIKKIDKALLPFTLYVEFEDSTKAFFFSRTSEVFKQLISSDPEKSVKFIKKKLLKNGLSN